MAGMAAAELEKKVKSMLREAEEEDDVTHTTFGQRAEVYYQKRPQLLSLLHHLYTSYLSLSHRRLPSSSSDFEVSDACSSSCLTADSDAESAVSKYYTTATPQVLDCCQEKINVNVVDRMVEEVVIGSVEKHLFELVMEEEEGGAGRRETAELRRKVELQRSLVEVLESERLILLKENARLGYDNRALAWEAAELGRCLMRLRRDDHRRSSLLARKIGDLQGQIEALERRNHDNSDQLLHRSGRSQAAEAGVRATVARWLGFLVCGAGLETGPGKGQRQGRTGLGSS